jgi:hypothetical protein
VFQSCDTLRAIGLPVPLSHALCRIPFKPAKHRAVEHLIKPENRHKPATKARFQLAPKLQ